MAGHVFVDENKTRGLLMAAAVLVSGDVARYRKTMAGLALPGQRRIHFQKESPRRQREILDVVGAFNLEVTVYAAPSADAEGRRRCLSAIVEGAAGVAARLVIERDESLMDFDRKVLYDAVRKYDCVDTLQYVLLA